MQEVEDDETRNVVQESLHRCETELTKIKNLLDNTTKAREDADRILLQREKTFAAAEVFEFLRSGRYRLSPEALADAVAGLPFTGWRQSIKRWRKLNRHPRRVHMNYQLFRFCDYINNMVIEKTVSADEAVAIVLRRFASEKEKELLRDLEKVSFRIFGLCRRDSRTKVGAYVRLGWDVAEEKDAADAVQERIRALGEELEFGTEWAVEHNNDANCYEGWEDNLRYLLMRYEEHLAREACIHIKSEEWIRIWEASPSTTIEHIHPRSLGKEERTKDGIFVHRLGNLMLLPPGINRSLGNKCPADKLTAYSTCGLLQAGDVVDYFKEKDVWDRSTISSREKKILEWVKEEWGSN